MDTEVIQRLPEEPDIRISLLARFRYIMCMRDMCEKLAAGTGFTKDEIFAVKLAFDEVLTNAFMHGCVHPGDDRIEIRLSIVEGGIYARVRDPGGKKFDYRKYKDFRTKRPQEIGTGLTLVDEFTDGWTVKTEEGEYTEVMFYKKKAKEDDNEL